MNEINIHDCMDAGARATPGTVAGNLTLCTE
jgi:hypothetical protein